MFELYATGDYSMAQIGAWARSAGMTFRKSGSAINKATIQVILRNRIYTGDFDWDGRTYAGTHVPLVSRELWERVQDTIDRRFAHRHRVVKHDFSFSGLVRCSHCGCAMVGEIKKGLYVYYHCTGQKGQRCPEKYVRQELLETKFADMLKSISLPADVLELARTALKESHTDENAFHQQSIARLHAEHARIQVRLEAMYENKLNGKISTEFFDRKAAEWQSEQTRLLRCIEDHQHASKTYFDEGVNLLELVSKAHKLFESQVPHEKRRLLRFVLSNCTWKGGELQPTFKQPLDLLAHSWAAIKMPAGSVGLEKDQNKEWLLR
jgi:site-specific DNA recombinase